MTPHREPMAGRRRQGTPAPGIVFVLVKPGKVLRAVCLAKSMPINLTLDETTQGEMAATLELGSDPPYRLGFGGPFGGTLLQDRGTGVKPSGVGLFKYKESPAPSTCPAP